MSSVFHLSGKHDEIDTRHSLYPRSTPILKALEVRISHGAHRECRDDVLRGLAGF